MKDLEHLRVLTISGEDAGELLQGQMTQDIRKLEDDKIHITSFCNVQGRVIASAFIQGRNDQYDLILSSEIIDDLENHLKRYVLRSKVVIEQSIEKTFGSYKSDVNEAVHTPSSIIRSRAKYSMKNSALFLMDCWYKVCSIAWPVRSAAAQVLCAIPSPK